MTTNRCDDRIFHLALRRYGAYNRCFKSHHAAATLGAQEGKELVLSMTLSGSNVKYLIKPPQADKKQIFDTEGAITKETVSSWELEKLGTALSVGEIPLPLGVAVKISD